jgi:hypothetical protein
MPVEIRELIIRAVVNDANEKREAKPDLEHKSAADQEAIIEECVRQVLKILKKSGER